MFCGSLREVAVYSINQDFFSFIHVPGYGNLNHFASSRTNILASVLAAYCGAAESSVNPPAAVTMALMIQDKMIASRICQRNNSIPSRELNFTMLVRCMMRRNLSHHTGGTLPMDTLLSNSLSTVGLV